MGIRHCLLSCSAILGFGGSFAHADTAQLVPAYPLYCQGPLTTSAPSGRETTTHFVWASTGAGATAPKPGQCAWADRASRGSEIINGGNVICDFSSSMKSVAANTFVEVGVMRDPQVHDCMHLFRYVGATHPPFSPVPALEPFTRRSVASLSAAEIASLRKGVQVMMSRPVTDPTSYAFQANIHGTSANPTDPAESASWNNCEHGSFFFTAWHRMYLYYFDRILRAAAGDPDLALPYWNWQDPAQYALPAPFRSPANASNSLYIAAPNRPAALDAGTALLDASVTNSSAADADTGFETGGTFTGFGFGGGTSAPAQFNTPYGDLETQPHNIVHSTLGGLMGDPITAAQDPIFWLHHAQVDRLWNRWIQEGGGRADSTDAAWLNTKFTFYDEAQHAVYLTGQEIVDTVGQLNYRYDDDPAFHKKEREREVRVAAERTAANPEFKTLATSTQTLTELGAKPARFDVPLAAPARDEMRSIAAAPARRVFLRIDDVHTDKPPGFYYAVYLNPPDPNKIEANSPGFVGNFSLFSMRTHPAHGETPAATHGFSAQFDVTRLLRGSPSLEKATVVLVPRGLVNSDGQQLPLEGQNAGVIGAVRFVTTQ
jgi:hypothetical protein